MGWEQRGNGNYYYRKKRVGKRVVSEYVGGGYAAELISKIEGVDKDEKDWKRWQARKRKADDREVDMMLDELETTLEGLVTALLLTEGYHMHRGEWRRQRG